MDLENLNTFYNPEPDLRKVQGKFVIINLKTMDYFKNDKKEIVYFDDRQTACEYLGFAEFNECSVLEILYTYFEE